MDRVSISTGIDEASQVGAFQNATLQSIGSLVVSIHTSLTVPAPVSAGGQNALAVYLATELGAAVKAVPGLSFEVQVGPATNQKLEGDGAVEDSAPKKVLAPKGVSITTGIPEDDQRGSFDNATLQGCSSLAFSIAARLRLPDEVLGRGDSGINEALRAALQAAVKASPALEFDVQTGPVEDANLDVSSSAAGPGF